MSYSEIKLPSNRQKTSFVIRHLISNADVEKTRYIIKIFVVLIFIDRADMNLMSK